MTTFDNREKAMEGLYAHDLDLLFRVNCRRDRLVAMWAAEQMGMSDAEAKAYVDRIVSIDCEKAHTAVHDAVLEDLRSKGVDVSDHRLRTKVNRLTRRAWEQVMQDDRLPSAAF